MIIVINRKRPKGEYLDGTLSINGNYICDTTENASSCIPEGIFTVRRWKCKQHVQNDNKQEQDGKVLAVVMDDGKPKCSRCRRLENVGYDTEMPCCCPQIKVGNGTRNRHDGRILVGRHFLNGIVENSLEAYQLIKERIRKSTAHGRQITLIIKNSES